MERLRALKPYLPHLIGFLGVSALSSALLRLMLHDFPILTGMEEFGAGGIFSYGCVL